ncbi:hypothetical protein SteCoe_27523 [Stentor coeruleus]|uniref:Uncharacterized protein n=1 Tax=Stentor coeruleus TaxID=5963 RepID=A0A1R2BAD0_9CILI|nr:hypothetical protein SteCoe_27523 [Stentor coeruleus]
MEEGIRELTGESYYSDNDLTGHLREKIRTQAQRLRALEQYRMLCEQRIQELSPGHSLPVKQEHLGSGVSLTDELQLAIRKISRLESQLSQNSLKTPEQDTSELTQLQEKYNLLIKEKNDLEESLRAEMINCEEQKTYIEVLKQAIEAKTQEFIGVKNEQKNIIEVQKTKPKNEDSRREQAKLKSTLFDLESQIKKFQSQVKAKDIEIESIKKERDQLEIHLTQAAETLQIAEEEVDKLEEEKCNLLEYVDDHSNKEQVMSKEFNELYQCFEKMKKDFDEAKVKLEKEKKVKEKLEGQIDVYNEEIFKANQMVKELQNTLNSYKTGTDDKENMIKKLKEDRLSYEIKVESLEANVATLSETLKETQAELENYQKTVESIKKQDQQKTEVLNKLKNDNYSTSFEIETLKETLNKSKKELETYKKEFLELEKLHETDIKQLQEYKIKISQYKNKFDSFEEDKKFKSELEQFRLLDQNKFSSLQEEYNELQENYRETQQRELIQSENLNELRKHNSELSREIEDLYKENHEISNELAKKNQECENFYIKLSQFSNNYEALENERKKLEVQLRTERNSVKALKDQMNVEKMKIYEKEKNFVETSENNEKFKKFCKEKDDEIQGLKIQLKNCDRELEDERIAKAKYLEDFKDTMSKLENKERDYDKNLGEIVECCKLIANFAGKYCISTHDYRANVSNVYKEFIKSWKEKITSSPKMLYSWIQNTIEEIESLARQIQEINKDLSTQTTELLRLNQKLESVDTEEFSQKQENSKLKIQLESHTKKYESLTESSEREIKNLRLEVKSLKNEISYLNTENNSLKDSLSKSQSENQELKINSEIFKSTLRTHEDKVNLLRTEKTQLESLLSQVQRNIASNEINKIYKELSRIRNELEILERERSNYESQLRKYDSEPKGKDTDNFKDLSQKLIQCERQIRNYRKTMQILQEDANKEEMVQKLRGNDKDHTRKSSVQSVGSPQTINLLNTRYVENIQVVRNKTPFS